MVLSRGFPRKKGVRQYRKEFANSEDARFTSHAQASACIKMKKGKRERLGWFKLSVS